MTHQFEVQVLNKGVQGWKTIYTTDVYEDAKRQMEHVFSSDMIKAQYFNPVAAQVTHDIVLRQPTRTGKVGDENAEFSVVR